MSELQLLRPHRHDVNALGVKLHENVATSDELPVPNLSGRQFEVRAGVLLTDTR